jgi:hypothetical protein
VAAALLTVAAKPELARATREPEPELARATREPEPATALRIEPTEERSV